MKIHNKNGFEYYCERFMEFVIWNFRPVGQKIWIEYRKPRFKTLKVDIERLLEDPIEAKEYYDKDLIRISDVKKAEIELSQAQAHYEVVQSPDFDLRGNNPDKESRQRKQATIRLQSAKIGLEIAQRNDKILKSK